MEKKAGELHTMCQKSAPARLTDAYAHTTAITGRLRDSEEDKITAAKDKLER